MKTCKANPLKLNETRFEHDVHNKEVDMLSVTFSLMVLALVSHVMMVATEVMLDFLSWLL